MARQTRSERRARRAAQAESRAALERSPQQRQPQQQQQVRPTPAPAQADGRHVPGEGGKRFVSESWAELKKVEWPGQSQVIQATVVVLIACIVVGAYLYVNDLIWKPVVQKLIGQ